MAEFFIDIYDRQLENKLLRVRNYKSLTWEDYLNKISNGELEVDFHMEDLTLEKVQPYNRVVIKEGSTVRWRGYIVRLEPNSKAPTLKIHMRDMLGYCQKRTVTKNYASQSVNLIAEDAIDEVNGDYLTELTYGGSTAVGDAAFNFTRQTLFNILQQCAKGATSDFWFDLNNAFQMAPQRGTDVSSTIHLRFNENRLEESNLAEQQVIIDGDQIVNELTGVGGVGTYTETNTTSRDTYGLLQGSKSYDAADADTLEALVQRDLDVMSFIDLLPKVVPVNGSIAPHSFGVGDTVSVLVKHGFIDINAGYRVLRKQYEVINGKQELSMRITLGEKPTFVKTFITEISDMQRRLYDLEQE